MNELLLVHYSKSVEHDYSPISSRGAAEIIFVGLLFERNNSLSRLKAMLVNTTYQLASAVHLQLK